MQKSIRYLLASLPLLLTASVLASNPLPVDAWVKTDIASVRLSHDGSYLGVLRSDDEREGHRIIWIYTIGDDGELSLFRRINSENMRIGNFTWLSDTQFIMGLSQQVRNNIDGFNRGVYRGRSQVVDLKTDKFVNLPVTDPGIEHLLPNEPYKLIVSENPSPRSGGRRTIRDGSYWHSYFEVDLTSMRKKLVGKAKLTLQDIRFDADGNPEVAGGFDINSLESVFYYREDGNWVEFARSSIDDWETFQPRGIDPSKPNHEFVIAHNGRDKAAVWSYDKKNKKFSELIYGRNDVDVTGTLTHSNRMKHWGDIVGVAYGKERVYYEFFPETQEGAIHEQFRTLVDNPFNLRVISVSRDGQSMVVLNQGPQAPRNFYLYHRGHFAFIGSSMPEVTTDHLSETKYIEYPARDGMTIPAHLTVPDGEAPFPLIVMPHGGPYVSEFIGFDPWAQMLADHGYAVLQPQYRGSLNFGLEFYQSAFIEKSEAGFAMQDDKDDGALYLVEQGIVDPDRMAMFGWSYGGYAALTAAMRTPQIYQCAVAGAAVSDPIMQVNYYRYRTDGVQKTEQLNTWDGAFSPFREIENVNIPLLVIHGENDQRVPIDHSRKLVKRLESAGFDHKYVEIKGIDHFSSTMFKSHLTQFYTELIDYLENDCGPEGV